MTRFFNQKVCELPISEVTGLISQEREVSKLEHIAKKAKDKLTEQLHAYIVSQFGGLIKEACKEISMKLTEVEDIKKIKELDLKNKGDVEAQIVLWEYVTHCFQAYARLDLDSFQFRIDIDSQKFLTDVANPVAEHFKDMMRYHFKAPSYRILFEKGKDPEIHTPQKQEFHLNIRGTGYGD